MKKWLVVAVVAASSILLQLVIPPFQSPDEPHHFAAILIEAKGETARDWAEEETIRLMDRHDWWRLAGVGRPGDLPERISDITFLMEGAGSDDFLIRLGYAVLFHKILGRFLGLLGTERADLLYLLCRLASLALYLVAVCFIYLTLRIIAKLWDIPAIQGLVFIALLPQFALTSTSVGPDAFTLALGAVFFWGAIRIILGRGPAIIILLLIGVAGIGFLSDRSAFFMGAMLLVLPFFVVRAKNWQNIVVYTLMFAVISVLLLYAAALLYPLQIEKNVHFLKNMMDNAGQALPKLLAPDQFQVGYWLFLADTFFLRFGWLAFGAPAWVYGVWRLICLAAGAGFLVYAFKSVRRRFGGAERDRQDGDRIRILLFSLFGLFIQLGGLWVFYGSNGIKVQGRYLFPLIAPLALIGILGLRTLGDLVRPGQGGRAVLASGLALEIFFFSCVVWALVVPKLNLTILGRFPGL